MKHPLFWRALLWVALFVVATSDSAVAQLSFTEDFSTTNHFDPSTTANWNTSTGRLELFPFAPTEVHRQSTTSGSSLVDLNGATLFATRIGGNSVEIYDVHDPAAPVLLSTLTGFGGSIVGMDVEDDRLYLSCGAAGLKIYQLSSPVSSPVTTTYLGTYDPTLHVNGVDAEGSLLYVSCYDQIHILDARDPTSPTLIGVYPVVGSSQQVEILGRLAFIAASVGGVEIVDMSNVTAPVLVSTIATTGLATDVEVEGRHLYVAEGNDLEIFDVTNPATSALIAARPTSGSVKRLWLDGSKLYLPSEVGGLEVVDVTDPSAPTQLYDLPLAGGYTSVAVRGRYAFAGATSYQISVVEMSQLADPVLRETNLVGGTVGEVQVSDGVAYVARSADGVALFDLRQPDLPILGVATTAGNANRLRVVGTTLYVAANDAGLEIFDVSDPSAPALLGGYDPVEAVTGLEVQGHFVFLLAADKVYSVDTSNPAAPLLSGTFAVGSGWNSAIGIWANRAFVPNNSVLRVVAITDPWAMASLGGWSLGETGASSVVAGPDAIYVGSNSLLTVLDPATVGTRSVLFDGARHMALAGGELYITTTGQELRVLDLSDPLYPAASPVSKFIPGLANGLAVVDGRAYVSHGSLFDAFDVSQRDWDTERSMGQSTDVLSGSDTFSKVRLTPTGQADLAFEVSADGGANWTTVPDGVWTDILAPGSSLRWRCNLATQDGIPPLVDQLTIEVLGDAPHIESITDVGFDQGKQVRLEWSRSAHDEPGDPNQITEYAIYRQVAPGFATAQRAPAWDFVTKVPVRLEDRYSTVVPTIADSTIARGMHWSTFRVTALTATPGVFYDSVPDSGYSVDNLAPLTPQALVASYQAQSVSLDWSDNAEADLSGYRIYRGSSPDFVADETSRVGESSSSDWVDHATDPWGYYYKVSAVDVSGNESSVAVVTTATSSPETPSARFAVYAANPNPFNPRTTLAFEVAAPARAELNIYDAAGRRVRHVVYDQLGAGRHEFVWKGEDDAGRGVASGVYFYEVRSGHDVGRKRMVLVR